MAKGRGRTSARMKPPSTAQLHPQDTSEEDLCPQGSKLSCDTCPELGGCDMRWAVYSLSAHSAPPAINCCSSKLLL